ncbi:MAG TPA: tubulin-like doman-containing protein [Gemmataceae bacterium]|jgi:serine/threonine protein kinase|nr:tubulin-like doman-containing protein [Gemmataceae bacterium]
MSLVIDANAEPIPGYRLIERIGGGGFGEVWKAEAPGGLHKAIKIIHGDLRSVDVDGARHAEQELRALKRLQAIRHPYLLSIERYDVIEGRVLIVTELADCNLWERFREMRAQQRPGIPRGELLRYMEEAAEVLDLMNTQYQLQHLDIKPQNLFLVYNHVKVADFGLVKDFEGMRGQITGGVTPVYAAPETFDGVVTRYSDQYSFAIVYQELLTGVRPFNGTSGQQLLLQHLREAPNLGPLPPADRAAVGRALSKRAEDRYPTCLQFVRALQSAGAETPAPLGTVGDSARQETPVGTGRVIPPLPPMNATTGSVEPLPPMETPKTQLHLRKDEAVAAPAVAFSCSDMALPQRFAPPEITGDGSLRPAVVIGIGQSGLEVAREFRRITQERFGSPDRIPHLKMLFLDTDSDTLHSATAAGALDPSEVIPARLNRPAHYLKPRRNSRSLIEGWFDPQTLYKIPRSPATVGMRALGRLAFLDHYKLFAERLVAGLEACIHPDAMCTGDRTTQLGIRTNRPRVYVVAGLGGGTGGGMFLDIAYAARNKLRQIGYADLDVVGLFLLPAAERGAKGSAVANAYTALRELSHYSRPDTKFSAEYEERDGQISDSGPPFSRCFAVPLAPSTRAGPNDTTREAARRAATFLANDLLSPLGRAVDAARGRPSSLGMPNVGLSVFGHAAYIWPRQALLAKAARWLSATVLTRWTNSDADVIGQYVKGWLAQRWQAEQLGPDQLVARLQEAGERILGQSAESLFTTEAQPYSAKGWFAREPDPTKLWQTLTKLQQLVGMPDERSIQRTVGQIEQKLDEAADAIARELAPKVARFATTLLEHPDYRLVGAEEAVKQVQAQIDATLKQYEPMAMSLSTQAIDAYFNVHTYLSADRGQKRPTGAIVAESIRTYPTWRYQSLILRQVCRVYTQIKTHLGDQLRELQFCRQRLDEIMTRFRKDRSDALPGADRILLPSGVASVEAAATALQTTITTDDLRAFDKKLQVQIEREFNALFNVCLSSISMLGNLEVTIEDQAKAFLSARLGDADLAQMFAAKFADRQAVTDAMHWLHDQAAPPLRLFGPERAETVLVGGPAGDAGKQIQDVAVRTLPVPPAGYVTTPDEVFIYREYADIPLGALPQLGPVGEDAYNAALDAQGCSPHIRNDVASWQDVEEPSGAVVRA